MVDRLPRTLVRLEGAAVALATIVLYFHADYPWWLLAALALAPDLALLGYAFGPVVGAVAYDLVHTYVVPVTLAMVGVVSDTDAAVQVGLIWMAHIGVDRAVGYGLKYGNAFRETHLQRI